MLGVGGLPATAGLGICDVGGIGVNCEVGIAGLAILL